MSAACAAVLLTSTLATAQDLNTDKTTYVTFSAPVALPGITLPAGDYLFKLLDSQVNRNVVQVYDHDRSKLFATVMAMPAQRNEVTGETVITFHEAPANAAPAVRYWYFPGDRFGQEFAYSKDQALQIANANHMPVLAVEGSGDNSSMTHVEPGASAEQAESAQAAAPAAEAPAPQPQAARTPEATTSAPAPAANDRMNQTAVGTSGTAVPTPAAEAAPAPTAERTPATAADMAPAPAAERAPAPATERELPRTGSELPLVGLAGLLALAAAFAVGAVRRSMV